MTSTDWPDVLGRLVNGADLDRDEAAWVMRQILAGEATTAQIAAFAVALRAKGEAVVEVEGLIDTMYEFAAPCQVRRRSLDIVGTGGDRSRTVNISTMAALVAAGAGIPVVKHGNRAASSSCGSADVVEGLGIPLDLTPQRVAEIADEVGITFCFAPVFHAALRHSASARRELGIPTTFNFLGPLANPSRPSAQAVGVADSRMADVIAGVLASRGVEGFVFRGDDGLDELTTTTTSSVWSIVDGVVTRETLAPDDLGIARSQPADLVGGDVDTNVSVVERLLGGDRGPVRDAVVLNAAAGIAAYAPAGGTVAERLREALPQAAAALDSGAAGAVLERWRAAAAAS